MRKLFLFVILSLTCLFASCQSRSTLNNVKYGKIDHYVAGLYIEIIDDNFNINGSNPHAYYNMKEGSGIITRSGSGDAASVFTDTFNAKRTKDEKTIYYGKVIMALKNSDIKTLKLYPIYVLNDGTAKIDSKRSAILKFDKSAAYQYDVSFEKDGNKCELQFTLVINKLE